MLEVAEVVPAINLLWLILNALSTTGDDLGSLSGVQSRNAGPAHEPRLVLLVQIVSKAVKPV